MHGGFLFSINVSPFALFLSLVTPFGLFFSNPYVAIQCRFDQYASPNSYRVWFDRRDLYCDNMFDSLWMPSVKEKLANKP
jgi:hypothetical protein